jgi:hypothetical protein
MKGEVILFFLVRGYNYSDNDSNLFDIVIFAGLYSVTAVFKLHASRPMKNFTSLNARLQVKEDTIILTTKATSLTLLFCWYFHCSSSHQIACFKAKEGINPTLPRGSKSTVQRCSHGYAAISELSPLAWAPLFVM